MRTTLRAAFSVLLLLGFYVLALAIVGVLGLVSFTLLASGHGGKVPLLTLAVAATLFIAFARALTTRLTLPEGVPVTPEQAPLLWQQVRELATLAQTRPPDDIHLVPDVNAGVAEQAKLLGLIGGRRRMYIGLPVLQGMTVSQLSAVLAHELGHYSRRHTRFGMIALRSELAIEATLTQLDGRLSGWLLKQYAKVYRLAHAAVRRRAELEADELAVQVAGRATVTSALMEIEVLAAAWRFYTSRYLRPGWEAGVSPQPTDFFGGFRQMIEARSVELATLREEAPPSERHTYSRHPSTAERIAMIDTLPDHAVILDHRPARDLVLMLDRSEERLFRRQAKVQGRRLVSWDEFTTIGLVTEEQREADAIYRSAARFADGRDASLATIIGLVEAGRLGEFASGFFPNATRREAADRFVDVMALLTRVAAIRSGAAAWRHSWSGPPTLIGRDGQPLTLHGVVGLAVDPTTTGHARAALAALGIDVEAAVAVDKVATAHGGSIIGGIANMKSNNVDHDVLILDNGLLMRWSGGGIDHGRRRLVAFAQSGPVEELAKATTFIPYEEISSATLAKRAPIGVTLTLRDGRGIDLQKRWGGELLAKDSDDVLIAALSRFMPATEGAG